MLAVILALWSVFFHSLLCRHMTTWRMTSSSQRPHRCVIINTDVLRHVHSLSAVMIRCKSILLGPRWTCELMFDLLWQIHLTTLRFPPILDLLSQSQVWYDDWRRSLTGPDLSQMFSQTHFSVMFSCNLRKLVPFFPAWNLLIGCRSTQLAEALWSTPVDNAAWKSKNLLRFQVWHARLHFYGNAYAWCSRHSGNKAFSLVKESFSLWELKVWSLMQPV